MSANATARQAVQERILGRLMLPRHELYNACRNEHGHKMKDLPRQESWTLSEIMSVLGPEAILIQGRPSTVISGIATDSRHVRPGDIFVAIQGANADGRGYIEQAVSRGASAIISGRNLPVSVAVPALAVGDTRAAAGILASQIYGNPSRKTRLIAITGTNGKTTISYLLEGILTEAGLSPGVIGTISYRHAGEETEAPLTTPGPVHLQRTLARMVEKGAGAIIMEASSHALDQKRPWGCSVETAVFTNMSRDHLDYHKTMDSYFLAKERLFGEYRPQWSVVNIDNPYGHLLWLKIRTRKISYGLYTDAMVRPTALTVNRNGIRASITLGRDSFRMDSPLLGLHNASNIMGAIAVARALDIGPDPIRRGIESVTRVPGRLESAGEYRCGVLGLVDYAHTPQALEQVLKAAKSLIRGRLICVTGCGGDRDRGKRPIMARAAAGTADFAIFTTDNPRSEDPASILEDMLRGLNRKNRTGIIEPAGINPMNVVVIQDREEAIKHAVNMAEPGDCVLVAGKGHETYQILESKRIPFDDMKILQKALERKKS